MEMMPMFGFVLCIAVCAYGASPKRSDNEVHWRTPHGSDDDPGEPLFLTPLLKAGQIAEARNLSQVTMLIGSTVESYTGLLTVNSDYNSNMFFWYVLAENNPADAPVMLWLQGGPAGASQYGMFYEVGPYYVDKDLTLQPREYAWSKNFNMLFIDNPVGAGFSFTESDDGYHRNEDGVTRDLYEALTQLYTMFPEHQKNDFYMMGESYAGKFVSSVGYKIDEMNNVADAMHINLKGLAIGNGFMDPITAYNYGDFLFELGLIDDLVYQVYMDKQAKLVELLQQGELMEAYRIFDSLVNGVEADGSLYQNATGMTTRYNFIDTVNMDDNGYAGALIKTAYARKAIHVGNITKDPGDKAYEFMLGDFMNTTRWQLEHLLNKGYNTILFGGQMDIMVPYTFVRDMVDAMVWDHAAEFHNTERLIWKVDPADVDVAGYVKHFDNLNLVLVRNAGHIVPFDQPRVSFDMITRFVTGKSFA